MMGFQRIILITIGILFFTQSKVCASETVAPDSLCPVYVLSETLKTAFEKPHSFKNLSQQELDQFSQLYERSLDVRNWRNDRTATIRPNSWGAPADLGRRYKMGDEHAKMLVKMGGTLEVRHGVLHLFPPTFKDFLSNYHTEIDRLIRKGVITEAEALYPAFGYRNLKTGDFQYVRPGIDPLPNARDWVIDLREGQIPHHQWEKLMAEGKLFFFIGSPTHELAHVTEYLAHPRKMAAVREYYQKAALDLIPAPKLPNQTVLTGSEQIKHAAQAARRAEYRIFAAEEFLALPDATKAVQIKERVPFVFESLSAPYFAQHKNFMSKLAKKNPVELVERAEKMMLESEKTLMRVGGAARDSYNLKKHGQVPDLKDWNRFLDQKSAFPLAAAQDSFARAATENLLGVVRNLQVTLFELERLAPELRHSVAPMIESDFKLMESHAIVDFKVVTTSQSKFEMSLAGHTDSEKKSFLLQHAAELLAQLESSYRVGLDLKFTPEKLVRDLTEGLNPNSATYQFFKNSHDPNSVNYHAFVEDRIEEGAIH